MNSFISDSLDESRGETKYIEQLKQKDKILKENSCTIASLRGMLEDLKSEIEDYEHSEEVYKRDISRLKKELNEKNEEFEAVDHALKEVEKAYENLEKSQVSQSNQVQKFAEELSQSKRKNKELASLVEQLTAQNSLLNAQLGSKELALKRRKRDDQEEERQQKNDELSELRKQVLQMKKDLEISESSWKLEKQHKERYARENIILDKKVNELAKQVREFQSSNMDLETRLKKLIISSPPPALPPKDDVQKHPVINNGAYRFATVDEVGEFMDASSVIVKEKMPINRNSVYPNQQENDMQKSNLKQASNDNLCVNHRIQKSRLFFNDPIEEEKMRLERVNELARRNKLTKPLHQTSYALELETFDETAGELDIKRGNVRRRVLADASNQPKPVFKKAEAFVV